MDKTDLFFACSKPLQHLPGLSRDVGCRGACAVAHAVTPHAQRPERAQPEARRDPPTHRAEAHEGLQPLPEALVRRGIRGGRHESGHRQHRQHLGNQHGLHGHHLPAPALGGRAALLRRQQEPQPGRAARGAALGARHVHRGLEALLPTRRDRGEPPHPHLPQRHRAVRAQNNRDGGVQHGPHQVPDGQAVVHPAAGELGLQHGRHGLLLDAGERLRAGSGEPPPGPVHGGGAVHIRVGGRVRDRALPEARLPLRAAEEHPLLHPGDVRALHPSSRPLLGLLLDQPVLRASSHLHRRHHGAHHDHADDGCPRVAAQRQLLHQGHRRLPGHLLQLHLRSAARVRGGSLLHAAPPRRGDAGRPLPRRRPRQERQRLLRLARGRRRGATRAPFHLLQIRVRPGRASTADGREPTTPRGGLCAPAGCVAHDPHCKSPSRRFLHRPEPSPHRQLLQEGLPPPVCTRQPPLLVLLLVPLISHRPRPRGGKGPSLRRGRISHTGPVASGRPAPPPGDAGRFISESKKRSRAV